MNVLCKRVHLLDRDPDNNPDHDLNSNPDNFALCKQGNRSKEPSFDDRFNMSCFTSYEILSCNL